VIVGQRQALLALLYLDAKRNAWPSAIGACVTFSLEWDCQRVATGGNADSPFLVANDFDGVLGRSHDFLHDQGERAQNSGRESRLNANNSTQTVSQCFESLARAAP
jgi:hypothetical protein